MSPEPGKGTAPRGPLSPPQRASHAGLGPKVPGGRQGGREAGRSRRRRIRRRRRGAAPGGRSSALCPETGPAGASGGGPAGGGEGRAGGCAWLAAPGRPTRTASLRRAPPARRSPRGASHPPEMVRAAPTAAAPAPLAAAQRGGETAPRTSRS